MYRVKSENFLICNIGITKNDMKKRSLSVIYSLEYCCANTFLYKANMKVTIFDVLRLEISKLSGCHLN